jgi:hypothetical protein
MASALINVVPKRVFGFSGSAVGAQRFKIFERLDVSQYTDCVMIVRVHSVTFFSNNNISFDVYGDGFTDNDPALDFMTSSPFLSILLDQNTPFPSLKTCGAIVRGHFITLVANSFKATTGSLSTVVVSVDMVLRGVDDSNDLGR